MKALAQNTLIQNRYLIVHLIGKGGMGEVYLAVDQRLGSAVALKRTYFAGDEMLGNAFEREARTLARMRHPVLPKVSDHFGENEEQYLVMEHISGEDLAKRLEAAQKPFPVSWVMFWADQLLDALSYLHTHEPPIIHRDIKPQNLKLTDDNHIILLDFGLSKTSTGQTHISNTGSTGSVVGYTPHYAPMEQIRGIGTNPRSDLYSLSATLYQLMTNVVPADALTRADAMLNGMQDPIEPPHKINPEIPDTVSEVILKGMEVSQDKRFGAAREMQKALRRAFTRMQEAMAAQTVAFNLGDIAGVEQPITPAAAEATRLMPQTEPPAPAPMRDLNSDLDFDATLAFDPQENLEQARQVGIKPEVYAPVAPPNGDSADAGPLVSKPEQPPEHDSFVTVIAGSSAQAPVEVPPPSAEPARAVANAAPQKSSSRVFAMIGGLAAVLVLGAGALAAAWYFYTNYYANAAVAEPAPSPAPTIEVQSAIPPATTDQSGTDTNTSANADTGVVVDGNTNSGTTDLPTNQTADVPAARSNSDAPASASRQNPAAAKPNVNRTAPKPAGPTPRPKTSSDRTKILQ